MENLPWISWELEENAAPEKIKRRDVKFKIMKDSDIC